MAQELFLEPPMPDIIEQWRFFIGLLDIQPGHRILDVGCNTGDTEYFILSLYPYVKQVVGIDKDIERINQARQLWEFRGKSEKIQLSNLQYFSSDSLCSRTC